MTQLSVPESIVGLSERCNRIFGEAIQDYHRYDDVDQAMSNPYAPSGLEHLLYSKNWIDNVQWHLEDIIREPSIDPAKALKIKRLIDRLNQERTDTVEFIDAYFHKIFKDITPADDARINTESPAWAIDRLSILSLKIYHMQEEAVREDSSSEHRQACKQKLAILLEQQKDLSTAIEELLEDILAGRKYMKVYRQMKMYNDPTLNPVLYGKKSGM